MLLQFGNYIDVLLNAILSKYFSTNDCFNVFFDGPSSSSINLNHSFVVYNMNDPKVDLYYPFYAFACQNFLVESDRPKSLFELIEHTIRFTPTAKFQRRKYLFYPVYEYAEDIFDSYKLEFVADLLLIKKVEDLVEFWTHKYVGRGDHRKPIILDKWMINNETFINNTNLYPDKLSNQNGRILRISTFDYIPYVNWDSKSGVELMMAIEFSKMFNLSYSFIYELDYWGTIYDNYTANGAKGTMLMDKADITMGSWYSIPNYTKYFDLTESTIRIGVTFLVPAPELKSGWLTPFFSFSYNLWIGFLFGYLAIIGAFFTYNYYYNKYFICLTLKLSQMLLSSIEISTVTLFLQQPLKLFLTTKASNLRLLLTMILFVSLIYSATYTAGFASILTIPSYKKGIITADDFENSGLKWGAIHPALLDSFRDQPRYKQIVSNILILKDEEINSRMATHSFSMLVDRIPNGIMLGNRINYRDIQYYRVLNDDVFTSICVMLTKRSSVLDPIIRKAFLLMKEFGLTYIWELKAYFEENYKAQSALKLYIDHNNVITLDFHHVQGAFGILCLGLFLSTISFFWEITQKRKK